MSAERHQGLASRRPRQRQRRHLGERRGHGAGQRRRPAHRARGPPPEPRVDAAAVEQVAAVRQHPDHVAVRVPLQADGAARRVLPLLRGRLPRLPVDHRRVRLQRRRVDAAELDVAVAAAGRRRRRNPAGVGHRHGRRGAGAAEVDGEGDGADEEEDADGDGQAVAEPAGAARPEQAVRGAG
uniref:Uncharacterized protein n=1 Tax=Triticum urartu TaxID=4572 RepID=A0A8R7VBQ3_TRIUA